MLIKIVHLDTEFRVRLSLPGGGFPATVEVRFTFEYAFRDPDTQELKRMPGTDPIQDSVGLQLATPGTPAGVAFLGGVLAIQARARNDGGQDYELVLPGGASFDDMVNLLLAQYGQG